MANKNNLKGFEKMAHIDDMKEIMETVKDKSKEFREKSAKVQKSISKYTKENPWKAIGLSVLIGAIFSKLF